MVEVNSAQCELLYKREVGVQLQPVVIYGWNCAEIPAHLLLSVAGFTHVQEVKSCIEHQRQELHFAKTLGLCAARRFGGDCYQSHFQPP